MEHRFQLIVRYSAHVFLGILVSLGLLACKKPNPNPELLDPIYIDLGLEFKTADGDVKAEEKAIEDLKKQITALPPRDTSRGPMTRELYKRERHLVQLKQKAQYFEIRQQQRKDFDQISYLKAFEADKPWPDAAEIAEYKRLKKLTSAPLSWDTRVPKATQYQKKSADSGSDGAKKEAKDKPAH